MKKYINFNTGKRKKALNSFEKDFFQPMNNSSVYGKTVENLSKKGKARLVNNAYDYKKYASKPSFVSQKIFGKTFVAVYESKPILILDKSIYVGFSILDLSKLLMYEFHYKYIELKYGYGANLLFTDTDCLVYEIERDNVYEDFYVNNNLFDFSDYPEDSKFLDPVNKKVIGKMKDEVKRKKIGEFVG